MMHKKIQLKGRQSGFTLVELIIALSVVTLILLASGVFSFSGAQSKSTNILSIMKELANGALRYNAHTGLMPKAPVSLFDSAKNTASETFQGVATTSWKGPYVNGFGADANGKYKLDAYVSGSTITFAKTTTGLPSGATVGYQAVVENIPNEIVNQVVADCNGTSTTTPLPTSHANGDKCLGTNDATAGVGTVKYLFSSM